MKLYIDEVIKIPEVEKPEVITDFLEKMSVYTKDNEIKPQIVKLDEGDMNILFYTVLEALRVEIEYVAMPPATLEFCLALRNAR